jgi:hypothetical protein
MDASQDGYSAGTGGQPMMDTQTRNAPVSEK